MCPRTPVAAANPRDQQKKPARLETHKVSNRVGLLCNGLPDTAGLPFIKSSDLGPICDIALGPTFLRYYRTSCQREASRIWNQFLTHDTMPVCESVCSSCGLAGPWLANLGMFEIGGSHWREARSTLRQSPPLGSAIFPGIGLFQPLNAL